MVVGFKRKCGFSQLFYFTLQFVKIINNICQQFAVYGLMHLGMELLLICKRQKLVVILLSEMF